MTRQTAFALLWVAALFMLILAAAFAGAKYKEPGAITLAVEIALWAIVPFALGYAVHRHGWEDRFRH